MLMRSNYIAMGFKPIANEEKINILLCIAIKKGMIAHAPGGY